MSHNEIDPPPTRDDVSIIKRDRVFDGYFKLDRYRLRHRKFDGTESNLLMREVLERGHVSAVLPLDLSTRSVVLIEQFRPGAYAAGWEPWLLECVAGIIETGEDSAGVARRESLEECGCRLNSLVPIRHFLTSPGAVSETVTLYAATTDAKSAGGVHGAVDEGEDIRVHVLSFKAAIALLDDGTIVNAKTIIALEWLARHENVIDQDWFASRSI